MPQLFFVAHTERGAVAEFRRHHAALFAHVVLTAQADKHNKAGLHIDIVLKSQICANRKLPASPNGTERITSNGMSRLS